MRLPPQIRVPLHRSPTAGIVIAFVALGTTVLTIALSPPAWARLGCAVALGAWSWSALRRVAWRTAASSALEILLSLDRTVVVRTRDGRLRAGVVRDASYVGPAVTTLVWKPDDARFAQAILVLPDMLSPEDFRRLRIALRYGRSEEEAGSPASHA
jgi:hypothetical protein